MAGVERLTQLLSSADESWSTARGVARHWWDQPLVTRAFLARSDRLDADPQTVTVSVSARWEGSGQPSSSFEDVQALTVDRLGRRASAELLTYSGTPRTAVDACVVAGDRIWQRVGIMRHESQRDDSRGMRWAGVGAANLLQPSDVVALFVLTGDGREEVVAGRRCGTLRATRSRVPPPEWDVSEREDPFDMVAGGEEFALWVDLEVGVLLRVVKLVSGAPADVQEFTALDLDVPLHDEEFRPLE